MTAEQDRLIALGFTRREAAALALLWECDLFEPLLDHMPYDLHFNGFGPSVVIDMLNHDLYSVAILYARAGFTGHQAWLIENDERARHNLHGTARRTPQQVTDLLMLPVPTTYKIDVLRASTGPGEARRKLLRYANLQTRPNRYRTRLDELAHNEAFLAALLPGPDVPCGCPDAG